VSRLNTSLEYHFMSDVGDVLFSIFAAVPVPRDVQQCHTLFNKWGGGLSSKSIKSVNQTFSLKTWEPVWQPDTLQNTSIDKTPRFCWDTPPLLRTQQTGTVVSKS